MTNLLRTRFEPKITLQRDRTKITAVGADHLFGRAEVVVKIIRKGNFQHNRESLAKFFSWHRSIQHPNLAPVFDAGLTPGQDLYCVREHYSGPSNDAPSPLSIAAQLTAAVSALHAGGQVHGSIKPSNIFYVKGCLKLTDPHILRTKHDEWTEEDIRFTAPEVLAGASRSAATDLYSLGAVLYRIFSNRHPFDDFDLSSLRTKYMWASPRPLYSVCSISESLTYVVERLLDKDPAIRPTLEQLREAFPSAITAVRAPVTGREGEMDTVRRFLDKPTSGALKVVLIEGEAGVGKTRLVEELRAASRFRNSDYAIGQCETESRVPFEPLVGALQNLLRERALRRRTDLRQELGNFWATLSAYFGPSAGGTSEDKQMFPPERVASDITGLLRSLAEREPLTLAVDDIHRADAHTLRVFEQLCLRAPEIPLNLILTEETGCGTAGFKSLLQKYLGEDFLALTLHRLTPAAARKALSYLITASANEQEILKASAGNPLFLEEYAAHQCSGNKLSPRLELILQSLLTALTRSAHRLAQVLSIFSRPADSDVLQCLSKFASPEFALALDELHRTGLITQSGAQISFTHESFRIRVYFQMPKSKRVRLHEAAYRFLAQRISDEELLAEHSFFGGIPEDAAPLSIKAANGLQQRANYPAAAGFYDRARSCLQLLGRRLDSESQSNLAFCYRLIGKHALAERIYRELLATAAGPGGNRELLASVYRGLTNAEFKGPVSDQIRLCCQAIDTAPPGWSSLPRVYALLGQLLVQSGELAKAQEAMNCAHELVKNDADAVAKTVVEVAQAYVWLHSGRFADAAAKLHSVTISAQTGLDIVNNNAALCWEHLGDLQRARDFQLKAQSVADSTGHAFIQLLSLINLGAFETKLGHFTEADRLFTCALGRIAGWRARDKNFRPAMMSVLYVDAARLEMELGRYRKAQDNLKLAGKPGIRALEGGNLLLAKCDLHICLGNTGKLEQLLAPLDHSEVFRTQFFMAERALVESFSDRFEPEHKQRALLEALDVSTRLDTLYQRCKILHRLSSVLLVLQKRSDAYKRASEALELAQAQGYKVLTAQALMAAGLAAADPQEKETKLLTALHSAVELGAPELLAESAFRIGVEKHNAGQYVLAEEYLVKSVSKTTELLQEVPLNFRPKYLAATWRKEAPILLQDCQNRLNSSAFSRSKAPGQPRDGRHFPALYRLALLSATEPRLDDFISSLLEIIEAAVQRPALLMLRAGGSCNYQSAGIKVSDELRARVRWLHERAGDRIYFGGPERGQTKDTLAWIPLRTPQQSGGLHLSDRHGETPLSEAEMEFLTIAGTIANESLRRIEDRATQPVFSALATEFHGIIGASKAISEVYSQIEIAASNAATVLIEGESGTGKELVAKAIHAAGLRAKEAFVAVDCGAIPEALIEAELFGAKKGSYTGAVADRPGLFEAAHLGTIFLDEISNTTAALQAKLLRVFQEREVRRIGETNGRAIDVRLIVASNRDLEALASEGQFRKDLLYRLKVLHIKLPPLRNRRDDIPMLADAFLQKLNAANKTKKHFAPEIIHHLSIQKFPGNVRELQNAIERAFFSAKGSIITGVPLEAPAQATGSADEVQSWFKELSEGRKDFWSAVHTRYKRRDISREKVLALVDLGLRSTRGSYKTMASMFHVKETDYRRFMDFLRRNECLLDFRPYRKSGVREN